MMAHRRRDESSFETAVAVPTIITKALSNHDELSELSTCIGEECGVEDSTELLFINLLLRTTVLSSPDGWRTTLFEALLRLFASYVSHMLLHWAATEAHVVLATLPCS